MEKPPGYSLAAATSCSVTPGAVVAMRVTGVVREHARRPRVPAEDQPSFRPHEAPSAAGQRCAVDGERCGCCCLHGGVVRQSSGPVPVGSQALAATLWRGWCSAATAKQVGGQLAVPLPGDAPGSRTLSAVSMINTQTGT